MFGARAEPHFSRLNDSLHISHDPAACADPGTNPESETNLKGCSSHIPNSDGWSCSEGGGAPGPRQGVRDAHFFRPSICELFSKRVRAGRLLLMGVAIVPSRGVWTIGSDEVEEK